MVRSPTGEALEPSAAEERLAKLAAERVVVEQRAGKPVAQRVDGSGNVFVADSGNNAIRKISTSGVVTTIVGVAAPVSAGNFPGPLPASILSPVGVAIDSSTGNLFFLESLEGACPQEHCGPAPAGRSRPGA